MHEAPHTPARRQILLGGSFALCVLVLAGIAYPAMTGAVDLALRARVP